MMDLTKNNDFEKYIRKLMEIERKLDLLQSDSEDLFDNLINKIKELTFNDKDNIIINYEHSLFHDIGSEIGFFRQNIILLYN